MFTIEVELARSSNLNSSYANYTYTLSKTIAHVVNIDINCAYIIVTNNSHFHVRN